MKYFFYFIILTSFAATPLIGTAIPKKCTIVATGNSLVVKNVKDQLNQIFTEHFRNDNVYDCFFCHNNVISLFQKFKEHIPDLKPEDFNVLIIAPELWLSSLTEIDHHKATVKRARYMYEPKYNTTALGYRYHVVLEYQGWIYDLDYTSQPTPITKSDYFINNFFSETELQLIHKYMPGSDQSRDKLKVVIPPSADYLTLNPGESRNKSYFQDLIRNGNDYTYLLKDYLLKD